MASPAPPPARALRPNVTRPRHLRRDRAPAPSEGIPAALATIVGTRGSTPGRTSMRLLVLGDGTFLGTVGGGCLEAEVYDTALQVLADEQPRSLQFRLTEQDSPDSGLMCGGEVTIFVEPLTTPALWIFGGGHVSKSLCQVAALAGSGSPSPTIGRATAPPSASPRRTNACRGRTTTRWRACRSASQQLRHRRHARAQGGRPRARAARPALRAGERLRFLGMIGSKTKQALLWKHLREQGIGDDFLATVRTPMGAYLGGKTHEEIAVSVVAELIAVRRLGQDLAALLGRP
jgi:xanthine dehydrogenase accessory factor